MKKKLKIFIPILIVIIIVIFVFVLVIITKEKNKIELNQEKFVYELGDDITSDVSYYLKNTDSISNIKDYKITSDKLKIENGKFIKEKDNIVPLGKYNLTIKNKIDEKKFEEELKKFKKQTSVENEESTEVYISNFMKSQNQTSRSPENKLQEVYISNPNNTNLSDTEMNDNKSNHIISVDEKRYDSDNRSEDYQAYENLVKETIDYESLEVTHHDDMRQVDEIVNLIVETVMCKNDKILIASNWYPASLVKKKFLMLTYSHIEYVLHCMSGNTTKVKNIKKYLLAALFNAPSTMNGYYQAEVNHDMPGLVR